MHHITPWAGPWLTTRNTNAREQAPADQGRTDNQRGLTPRARSEPATRGQPHHESTHPHGQGPRSRSAQTATGVQSPTRGRCPGGARHSDNGVPSKTATHQTPQSAQSLNRTRHARRRALKYRISHTDTLLP